MDPHVCEGEGEDENMEVTPDHWEEREEEKAMEEEMGEAKEGEEHYISMILGKPQW